jgi:hypothetical protein
MCMAKEKAMPENAINFYNEKIAILVTFLA